MSGAVSTLPTGRRGQVLASGITLIGVVLLWFALVSPLLGWYADRAEFLRQRQVLASRMEAVAATAPELMRQAQDSAAEPQAAVLEGATEGIAAATLQQRLQEMAERAGVRISSAEALPAEPVGAFRRIRLRLSVTGPWLPLVRLLSAIGQASPPMLVDDLQLNSSVSLATGSARPLNAGFTVIAFNPAGTR